MGHRVKVERKNNMGCLGNGIWFICGGFLSGISWFLAGILCCLTVLGVPLGVQCFKFASLAFFPFGKDIEFGGNTVSLLANILWLIFLGIPMAVENAIYGLLCCITIIGIPFGMQFFKLAKLSLLPFGASIVYI